MRPSLVASLLLALLPAQVATATHLGAAKPRVQAPWKIATARARLALVARALLGGRPFGARVPGSAPAPELIAAREHLRAHVALHPRAQAAGSLRALNETELVRWLARAEAARAWPRELVLESHAGPTGAYQLVLCDLGLRIRSGSGRRIADDPATLAALGLLDPAGLEHKVSRWLTLVGEDHRRAWNKPAAAPALSTRAAIAQLKTRLGARRVVEAYLDDMSLHPDWGLLVELNRIRRARREPLLSLVVAEPSSGGDPLVFFDNRLYLGRLDAQGRLASGARHVSTSGALEAAIGVAPRGRDTAAQLDELAERTLLQIAPEDL